MALSTDELIKKNRENFMKDASGVNDAKNYFKNKEAGKTMNKSEAREALLDKKLVRYVNWPENGWCSFNFETMHITDCGGDHVDWTDFDDDDQFAIFHPIKVKPKKVMYYRRAWLTTDEGIRYERESIGWAKSKTAFDEWASDYPEKSEEWEQKEFEVD